MCTYINIDNINANVTLQDFSDLDNPCLFYVCS